MGFIKNRYVGRTFIMPGQAVRKKSVRQKLNPIASEFAGKNVLLVDDSIVRGTTSQKIVQMVREAGAKEVHFRSASPPIKHPDFYGIDTPEREKLLASRYDVPGMAKFIGVDSLAFLSIDGMYRAMGFDGRDPANPKFADHCFTGAYPTHLTDQTQVEQQPHQLSLLAEAS